MKDYIIFDIETAYPPQEIIEFGAIVLDGRSLKEKQRYQTLIYSDKVSWRSEECNGISQDDLSDAPSFGRVAKQIFDIMDDKIWVGHNIKTFDIPRLRDEFEKIYQAMPEPSGIVDTLPLLRKKFKGRTDNFKMATLGNYFELGEEQHRAVEDCEMTIEVFKNVATTLMFDELLK